MNLQDRMGAVVSTKTFTHFVWHQGALHLSGKLDYTIRGQNLHFLVPFLATGLFPENLLNARNEELFQDVFPPPISIRVTEVVRENPELLEGRVGLGRPLPIKIPASQKYDSFRWLLVEGDAGTALHPFGHFHFVTPSAWQCEWHLVFESQAYALEFDSAEEKEALKPQLLRQLPEPDNAASDPKKWVNIFSIFSAGKDLEPRFLAKRIRRMDFRDVDTSRLAEMSGQCVRVASLPKSEMGIGREMGR
jgi:hypothetical protein